MRLTVFLCLIGLVAPVVPFPAPWNLFESSVESFEVQESTAVQVSSAFGIIRVVVLIFLSTIIQPLLRFFLSILLSPLRLFTLPFKLLFFILRIPQIMVMLPVYIPLFILTLPMRIFGIIRFILSPILRIFSFFSNLLAFFFGAGVNLYDSWYILM